MVAIAAKLMRAPEPPQRGSCIHPRPSRRPGDAGCYGASSNLSGVEMKNLYAAPIIFLLALSSLCLAQPPSQSRKLVGTWELVCVEQIRPNGEALPEPSVKNPVGLLVYDSTGHMSFQMMRRRSPDFASENDDDGTPDEIKCGFQLYGAYFGRYDVNASDGVITYPIDASLFPNLVGKDVRRFLSRWRSIDPQNAARPNRRGARN